jgi:DnaK suppressor protein
MKERKTELTASFIEGRRQQLIKLRRDLVDVTQGKEDEEVDVNASSGDDARESEDDAQRLTILELDGNLVARNALRLARIERALRKMEEGTYGFSDATGKAIPLDRLEAIPDAIFTVEEQDDLDKQPNGA